MGKIIYTVLAVCSCVTAVTLVVLLFVKRNEIVNLNLIKRSGKKLKFVRESEVDDKKTTEECPFGFDFLDEIIENKRNRADKRRFLPEHLRQNFSGALVNKDLMCLDTMDATENQWVGIYECHGQGRNQAITFTTDGFILTGTTKPLCLATKNMVSTSVILKKCNKLDRTQIWTTDSTHGLVIPTIRKDHCLKAPLNSDANIMIELCKRKSITHKWQLVMQEVLSLWIEGPHRNSILHKKKQKTKEKRKRINKLILQNKPTEKNINDDLLNFE